MREQILNYGDGDASSYLVDYDMLASSAKQQLNSSMVKAESFMNLRKYNVTLESCVSQVCMFREL